MMRIGQFTTLPFVLTIFMGCGGLPEKLPESAFDVPPLDATTPPSDTAIDITPTDVMPPEDILSDVPPLDVPPPEDILADVPPAPDTTPDVPVTPGTFAAECDVVGNFVAVDTDLNLSVLRSQFGVTIRTAAPNLGDYSGKCYIIRP